MSKTYLKSDHFNGGRSGGEAEQIEDGICGVLFNAQGYLHEVLKRRVAMEASDGRIT